MAKIHVEAISEDAAAALPPSPTTDAGSTANPCPGFGPEKEGPKPDNAEAAPRGKGPTLLA